MIGLCPLASGSKGNSIYLGSQKAKILIDIGICHKELLARLNDIGVDLNDIDAILITHEHIDHIEGLKTLTQKVDIPVFANSETAKGIHLNLKVMPKFKIFTTDETFEFKDLIIHPFSIQHDTLDPVAFVIKTGNIKIGICTDLGFVTSLVKKNLEMCDYLYIEANHDVNMLFASRRPDALKKRIIGRQGHLSNIECVDLIRSVVHPGLKQIYLAHLSGECNSKDLSKALIEGFLLKHNPQTKVSIAHQDKVSDPVFF